MAGFKLRAHKFFNNNQVLLVLIGSIPGGLLRWQLNNDYFSNLLGSFLLGVVIGLKIDEKIRLFFVIGFCGSLTTFSGWILSSFELLIKGFFWHFSLLICGTFLAGFFSLTAGFFMGRKLKQLFLP